MEACSLPKKSILAIETSTVRGSVVLARGEEVLFGAEFHADRSHNSMIFGPLRLALEAGKPELVVVGTGPGSYSGIRVGLAAAVGLGMATEVPVIGWPSLTAFDAPARFQVVGDARRGLVFAAEVSDGRIIEGPELMKLPELVVRLSDPAFTFDAHFPVEGVVCAAPSARWLARRAAALSESEINALAAATPEPVYLHEAFVTTPRPRRGAGQSRSPQGRLQGDQ
jgi:tRNA threonylcarbamoyladenosine biosynthesis protein TsaB